MTNLRVTFEVSESNEMVPVGYTKVPLRVIFDLKLDFTRIARLVAGGHMTNTPT